MARAGRGEGLLVVVSPMFAGLGQLGEGRGLCRVIEMYRCAVTR